MVEGEQSVAFCNALTYYFTDKIDCIQSMLDTGLDDVQDLLVLLWHGFQLTQSENIDRIL